VYQLNETLITLNKGSNMITTKQSEEWYGRADGERLHDMTDEERSRCFDVFLATGNQDTRKGFMGSCRNAVFSRTTGEVLEV